ncbi:MAG TPA: hypothetical protein VLL52_05565 [Anaerolineae bacterium]|nr:hypothetical protein [Anaerolineae bacterium]
MGVVVVTIVTGVGALLVSGRNKDNVHRDMYIEMSRVLKVVDYVLTSKGIPFKKRKMYGRIVFLLEGETLAVRVCQQTLRYRQRIVGTRLELVGITEENRLLADKLRQKLDEGLQLKGE